MSLFSIATYDLEDYNVAAALENRNRLQVGDTEYICNTCHSDLVTTQFHLPMMPRNAVAHQNTGPGVDFLRMI